MSRRYVFVQLTRMSGAIYNKEEEPAGRLFQLLSEVTGSEVPGLTVLYKRCYLPENEMCRFPFANLDGRKRLPEALEPPGV